MLVATEVEREFLIGVKQLPKADPIRVRRNTVRCDFSHLKRELCVLEMHDFVDNYLRLPPDRLERLQWNGHQRCLFLRLKDFRTAQQLVEQHNGRHRYPPGRLWARIFLSLEDTPTEVMLYDLSELVTDADIKAALDAYGVVVSIEHNKWRRELRYGGIPSGHRLVHMVIRRPIPQLLNIGNEPAVVVYIGQDEDQPPAGCKSRFGGVFRYLRRLVKACLGQAD
uniref:Uncharacterized protein n=1 Tax=Anopheles farauti TaxID=69004 RepID=A0A182Q1G4_9DIPT